MLSWLRSLFSILYTVVGFRVASYEGESSVMLSSDLLTMKVESWGFRGLPSKLKAK